MAAMGIPKEVLLAQARRELAQHKATAEMLSRMLTAINEADAAFTDAGKAGGLGAVALLVHGFTKLAAAQRFPAEFQLANTGERIKELEESLKRADSPILQPNLVPPSDARRP